MRYRVLVSPRVEGQIEEAADWWFDNRRGAPLARSLRSFRFPASELQRLHAANLFAVLRQLRYSEQGEQSFEAGLPD